VQAHTRHPDAGPGRRDRGRGSSRRSSSLRLRAMLALATVVVAVAALIGSPLAQAIIMRDGVICDPIRHMGC
jgi:hypothetical protein